MNNEQSDSADLPRPVPSSVDGTKSNETRQERREKKLKKKRERIPQHGKGLAKVYRDVVEKRKKGTDK
ncbi:MAG: hypothetical protein HYX84_01715 [Chloroflexi bacterium]|nr:hypothetical protein [Chloroflexota bacterium]